MSAKIEVDQMAKMELDVSKMDTLKSRISEITIKELELFILASKTHSLREVARQSNLLPAHISKAIKRIESKFGVQLFRRSVSGVFPTAEAGELLQIAEKICEMSEMMKFREVGGLPKKEPILTVGSISFLSTYLLAPCLSAMRAGAKKKQRFRLMEFSEHDLVAHGLQGAFEIAVHIGKLEWTRSWESMFLGTIPWKLYGRKNHPLSSSCSAEDVLLYPFVVPTDWNNKSYIFGEDQCPVPIKRRIQGDEAATAETALKLCLQTNQLTFVPEIIVRGWGPGEKKLSEIKVRDWPLVEKDIYLTVKSDCITQKLMDLMAENIKSCF